MIRHRVRARFVLQIRSPDHWEAVCEKHLRERVEALLEESALDGEDGLSCGEARGKVQR